MRRRGTSPPPGATFGIQAHSIPGDGRIRQHDPTSVHVVPVPEEWRDNAGEPWKILFPDLEWTPPDRDL